MYILENLEGRWLAEIGLSSGIHAIKNVFCDRYMKESGCAFYTISWS